MDNHIIKSYRTENAVFSAVFLFGLHYAGRKLVIIRNDIVREEFLEYLKTRDAQFGDNQDVAGFCVYGSPDTYPSENLYSCVAVVELNGNKSTLEGVRVPTLTAVLDMDLKSDDDYWNNDWIEVPKIDYPHTPCFLMNDQIKELFLKTFKIAEREIDIISPWINRYVLNEEVLELFNKCIKKGVKIKILYGIGSDEIPDPRQKTTEKAVEMLRERFSGSNLLKLKKGNTHMKHLICDDKYMMCGSYNLLSFAGDYSDTDEHDEGMEYIVNRSQIDERRRQLFSWD